MNRINWARLVICGLITGGIWGLLSLAGLLMTGDDFLTLISGRQFGGVRGENGLMLHLATMADGLWAMWLYAAVSARFGRGPRTAAASGAAVWAIVCLQSFKWITLASIPPAVAAGPVAASLPAIIGATMIGAWCYDEHRSVLDPRTSGVAKVVTS